LIRADIWRSIQQFKDEELALIVIDKHLSPMLQVADRHYVIAKGRVVWSGSSDELRSKPSVLKNTSASERGLPLALSAR
jgi:branched-chain amino acid transport system ATP-binding protein